MSASNRTSTSEIKVQVIPSPERAGQLSPGKTWETLEGRIAELGQSIGTVAAQLRSQLDETLINQGPAVTSSDATATAEEKKASWTLDEVTIKFSLDLEAEAGVVVARAKTTAGFEVELSWKRG